MLTRNPRSVLRGFLVNCNAWHSLRLRGLLPVRHPQFDEPLVVKRGDEESETLLHPCSAIGEGIPSGDGDFSQGLPIIHAFPDKTPEIVEADLGVGHQPPEVVKRATETSRLRPRPLHDDPRVPIGLPPAEPMGYATHDLAVDDLAHERDRRSGSHTRRIKSNG